MGAWGTDVFDNDSACDFMYYIEKPIEKLLLKKINYYDYADYRAAAEIIIKLSDKYRFTDELPVAAVEKLNFVLRDRDWINSWCDEKDIIKDLKRQIRALNKIIGK